MIKLRFLGHGPFQRCTSSGLEIVGVIGVGGDRAAVKTGEGPAGLV
jgi:hypothetical protein